MRELLMFLRQWREENRQRAIQQAADDAEINKACWELRCKHRERDLLNRQQGALWPR